MSVTPLNWRAAGALAEQLLAGWQRRGEPGGAITLFDAEQPPCHRLRRPGRSGAEYPFTVDSVVRYASVTKHIFAALALNATGCAIRLDQRLGELLPALQPALADVTVGQALDMTGGLPTCARRSACSASRCTPSARRSRSCSLSKGWRS